ncbi:MAG: polyprenol monophosphomannose synthase [Patescibacteria group bacterium]|nr:polyprenol monophosphomannose synthase [Patescibacteria group bacterium]
MISLIIPTYNERENIEKLFSTLSELKIKNLEVIIVDDNSPDGTADKVEVVKKNYPLEIKLIRRKGQRDLSLAVLEGFKNAQGKIWGVMDADLSHPPELILPMIEALKEVDLVIASRRVKGSRIKNWPLKRKVFSGLATFLAKILVPKISDPLSGFFFFRKEVVEGMEFSPLGYKIGLEIFVKGKYKNFREIPYLFIDRKKGASKLSWLVIGKFILHLLKLFLWKIKKFFGF